MGQTRKLARSIDAGDYQEVPRPVAAMAKEFADGFVTPRHHHRRAQLIHAIAGTMRVTTPDGAWVVPPLRAVWLPPELPHDVAMIGAVSMRTLYVEPASVPFMPDRCLVVEVAPLLRELILGVIEEPVIYPLGGRAETIATLILEELRRMRELPLRVPLPAEPRLRALCLSMLDDLSQDATLEDWAERAGASGRTLARLFLRETGLSFGAWRRQARLAEALARLTQGKSVAEVATALGYGSPSAFTAMFRRTLGEAPSRYMG